MRHKKHQSRMNRQVGHRNATLRNLSAALVDHGRIRTTHAKAKILRPYVEKLITMGKKGTLHHRRLAFAHLQKKKTVHKIFEELAPRFEERNGGYTRIIMADRRQGDGAQMALIEFVDHEPAESADSATT
jgi:large subunit ribosomal protein L17